MTFFAKRTGEIAPMAIYGKSGRFDKGMVTLWTEEPK